MASSSSQLCLMRKERHNFSNLRAQAPKFAKRVSTLKKKAMELSVLCDVSVCVICYGPDGDLHCWPENPLDVGGLVAKYRGLRDEDRVKHSVDLKGFLATESKKNGKKPILESSGEMDLEWDERIDGFSDEELGDLMSRLDSKLVRLTAKLNGMMNSEEANLLERTNVHLPGVVDYDPKMQEPRVHRIEVALENDGILMVDDFFRELKDLINYELPVGGSDADRGSLGFDTITTNYVIDSGFDFSRENLYSGYGDVYNYCFTEVGDFDAEIQQFIKNHHFCNMPGTDGDLGTFSLPNFHAFTFVLEFFSIPWAKIVHFSLFLL